MNNQYEIMRNKLCHIIEKDFCPDPCKRKDITCENCQVERLFRAINQHYIPRGEYPMIMVHKSAAEEVKKMMGYEEYISKSDALKLAQETGKLINICNTCQEVCKATYRPECPLYKPKPDTELVEIIIKHSIGSYTTLGYIVDENKLAQAITAAGYKKEKGDL